jgi:hypothetical protein
MRTFDRYINRKRITDVKKYFSTRGITSDEGIRGWCLSQEIEPPTTNYFITTEPVQPSKVAVPEPIKVALDESGEPEVWHVPAAERPLRKSSKTGKKTTRPKTQKKNSVK